MQNGNPVGSLSELQRSLVEGCLLGDGYMRCKTNAHLEINHSIHQKDYVDWKYEHLKEFILTAPKARRGNGNRIGYRFFTRSLPVFTEYYRRFYLNGKKIIPQNLELTPLTLAVWFMDDGSRSYKSCYFNTQKFIVQEQEYLLSLLLERFGLRAKIDRDGIYNRLRLPVDETGKLTKIINSLVIPSLRYKLPI